MKTNKVEGPKCVLDTLCPIQVSLDECGGDSSKMIKRFTKKVKKSGIFDELRNRSFFKTKSQKREYKRKLAKKNK